jgi:hypothetical protein
MLRQAHCSKYKNRAIFSQNRPENSYKEGLEAFMWYTGGLFTTAFSKVSRHFLKSRGTDSATHEQHKKHL